MQGIFAASLGLVSALPGAEPARPTITLQPLDTLHGVCQVSLLPAGATVEFSYGTSMFLYRMSRLLVASLPWAGTGIAHDGIDDCAASGMLARVLDHFEADLEGGPHYELPPALAWVVGETWHVAVQFLFRHEIGHVLETRADPAFVMTQLMQGTYLGTGLDPDAAAKEAAADMFAIACLSMQVAEPEQDRLNAGKLAARLVGIEVAIVAQFLSELARQKRERRYSTPTDRLGRFRLAASRWTDHADLHSIRHFFRAKLEARAKRCFTNVAPGAVGDARRAGVVELRRALLTAAKRAPPDYLSFYIAAKEFADREGRLGIREALPGLGAAIRSLGDVERQANAARLVIGWVLKLGEREVSDATALLPEMAALVNAQNQRCAARQCQR